MGMKRDVPIPKNGTTQPCQRGVNVDHEKSLGNYLYDGIDIYAMMAHNIKICFFIFFYMKYLMIIYWWVTSYEFVVRIIYLKGLFPHLEVSKFYLLSISPPFISLYRYIRGIIGVEIPGRQQLLIILWYWGFYYCFYGIKHCTGELFLRVFLFLVD